MLDEKVLGSSSVLQTTEISLVNLEQRQRIQELIFNVAYLRQQQKIQELMLLLPFTTILKYLQAKQKILEIQKTELTEKQKTLEIQKTKLTGLKDRRVLECITFLSIREDLDYKNKIQFIKILEEEFESYIEIGDLKGAESILLTLYHNHERWQPYCPIKRKEEGGYYYQTSFKN